MSGADERNLNADTGEAGGSGDASMDAAVDAALARRFGPPAAMPAELAARMARVSGESSTPAAAVAASARSIRAGDRGFRRPGWFARAAAVGRRRPLLAAAASIALVVTGAWLAADFGPWARTAPGLGYVATGPFQSVTAVYAARVRSGFEPDWACEDDAEFRSVVDRLHGQPISMAAPTSEVHMLGVAPSHTFSRRTLNVLMRVDGVPVIVVIDRGDRVDGRDAAIDLEAARAGQLFVHRRSIGDLALVELSPFPESRALPVFQAGPREPSR